MVLTSGCFDGVHAGHVRYLQAAKDLCDADELLICAVAPDAYITHTKHRRPHWTQAERVEAVNGLQDVDAAIPQIQPSVSSLIRAHRPRLFVKGCDWKNRIPEDVHRACEDCGTVLAYVETEGTHVSETVTSDEAALEKFEALVQSQQAPVTPWQPVTPFDFESRKAIEGPHAELIAKHLTSADGSVLDFGCGPEGHLVRMLKHACRWHHLDIEGYDPQAQKPLRHTEPEARAIWDLVICREVLEHCTIKEIRRLVTKLCALSSYLVYVTTRFAKEPTHLLDVDTSDNLDPTHISMLTQPFLRTLFVLEGFKRRPDLEAAMDHRNLGRVLVYERA